MFLRWLGFLLLLLHLSNAQLADAVMKQRLGGTVNIPCVLTPDQEPVAVEWLRQGQIKMAWWTETDGINIDPVVEDRADLLLKSFNLVIRKMTMEDTAEYECRTKYANDTEFQKERTTQVNVIAKPSPPSSIEIFATEPNMVKIRWRQSLNDNNAPIIRYVIQLKELEADWGLATEYEFKPTTLESPITGVRPYTMYVARVMAENEVGKSDPVQSEPQRTKPTKPSAKPVITKLYNVSSTTVGLSWEAPPPATHNGIITRYELELRSATTHYPITIGDPRMAIEDYRVDGLHPYTDYQLYLSVCNKQGCSAPASKAFKTDEGVPTALRIYDIVDQNDTSFRIKWEMPRDGRTNGIITKYELIWRVYREVQRLNETENRRSVYPRLRGVPVSEYVLGGLQPYTPYRLEVVAHTRKGAGARPITDFQGMTDVRGPSAPVIEDVKTNDTSLSVEISWKRPVKYFKNIDRYRVEIIRQLEHGEDKETFLPQLDNPMEDILKFETGGLLPMTRYALRVAGETKSLFSDQYMLGAYSKPYEMVLRGEMMGDDSGKVIGGLVGALLVVLILLVSVTVIYFYRRRKAPRYLPAGGLESTPVVVLENYDKDGKSADPNERHVIRAPDWEDHVKGLHKDSDLEFSQLFEEITRSRRSDLTNEHSLDAENKHKNRYNNITAYDHSRVSLKQLTGKLRHSHYINANYVDGFHKSRAYIATQGPLPTTIADFWRMVWEQNSNVIVMITNLVEKGRVKCDQYWPNEGHETYGMLQVRLLSVRVMAHYTIRVFTLKHNKTRRVNMHMQRHPGERVVYQYHYTDWPDHGVPDYALPVLKLVQKSSEEALRHPDNGAPIVHCSAGVGRTGTYIVLDAMMRQIREKGTVNVFGFLVHIRNQRNFLVQNEEQFIFIHDALVEFIRSGGRTEIPANKLCEYVERISTAGEKKESEMEQQFNIVTSYRPPAYEYSISGKNVNQPKNRTDAILPLNQNRVILPARPGVDGSDYINASYLHGYRDKREYILTQHPLESTQVDFWRMVWDQNSSTMLLLVDSDDESCLDFWPSIEEPLDCQHFTVSLMDETRTDQQVIRDFLLESKQDDYELMTRILSVSGWPDRTSFTTCLPLIKTVKSMYKEHQSGPVIVVDKLGSCNGATFCALATLYDECREDDHLDVYQLVRLYVLQLPGVFTEQAHMDYIYRVMVQICKELSETNAMLDHASNHAPPGGNDLNHHQPNSTNHSPVNDGELKSSLTHSLSHNQALNYYQQVQHRQWKGERPPRPETTI